MNHEVAQLEFMAQFQFIVSEDVTLKPDLVLMDLSMPKTDGITAIKEIKKCLPEIKILALTVHKTEGQVRMALESGADGYILKDASCTELEMAIRNILDGKSYLSPEISDSIIRG